MLRLRKEIVPGNAQREGGWCARWKRMIWEKWGRVALGLGMLWGMRRVDLGLLWGMRRVDLGLLWGMRRGDALVLGMFWSIRIDLEGGNALGNDPGFKNKVRDQNFVPVMLLRDPCL
jgi:hypothetical protein